MVGKKGGEIMNINLLAVLTAAIANMIVGSFWYSPLLFAKQWMKLIGKKKQDLKPNPMLYIGTFICALVTAYIMSVFAQYTHATTISGGLQLGFLTWVGFVATTSATNYLFEGRPKNLYFINYGYHLVTFLIMGIIVAVL